MAAIILTRKHDEEALFLFDKEIWDENMPHESLSLYWKNHAAYKNQETGKEYYMTQFYIKSEPYDNEYDEMKETGGFDFRFRGFLGDWQFGYDLNINNIDGSVLRFTKITD